MALRKDGNSKNSASYKPYDSSNSLIKQMMTNSVSGVKKRFPGLFNWGSTSQSEREPLNDVLSSNLEDDRAAPAVKRMKVQNEEDKTLFKIVSNSGKGLQDTCSPIKPVNDMNAAGPSNRNKCIVSSTPAFENYRSPVFSNTLDQSSSKRIAQSAEDSEVADISTTLPQFSVHQRHNITVPSLPKDVPNMMSTIDANKSLTGSFSSANSRRPSFNVDVFSSSSRRLSLSVCEGRNRNCLSPFYSARTMYGGASALLPYGSQTASRMRSASTSKLDVFSPRSQITMQPVPSPSKLNDQEILSASARRILDSLDKYCSPVADAKRIPVNESSRKSIENTQQPLNRGVKRKLPTLNQMLPSTSELLRIKRTEKIQDSVSSAKQTVSTVPESSIAAEDSDASSDSAELDYSVLSQESKDTGSHYVGKLTRKNESKFDDRPKPVNLPNAVLKISNLPKFDVTDEFVFSKPLLLENLDEKAEEAAAESVAKNNKSTQSPAAKSVPAASPSTLNAFSKDVQKPLFSSFNTTFSKNSTPTIKSSPTSKLTDDSSPSSSSSSSPTSKFSSGASTKSSSSGSSPKVTNWTCMKCFTMNTAADECSKCSQPRPPKAQPLLASAKSSVAAAEKNADSVAKPLVASSWGDKFKPAADTWECPECLVRNKNASTECVACGKAKNNVPKSNATATNATAASNTFSWTGLPNASGGWSGAQPADSKSEQTKEPSKSDVTASKEPAKPQPFSFGVDKSGVSASAFGQTTNSFKFGASDKPPAGSISFGTPAASTAASAPVTFTFGIKPANSQPATNTGDSAATIASNGETGAVTSAPIASFTFGLPKAPETSVANATLTFKAPAFGSSFGASEKPAAEKKEGSSIFNDVSSTSNSKNPLLANDASVFKTPKFAAPKTVAAATRENGDESGGAGNSTSANLFNDISSSTETPKKKMALFSSVLSGEPSNGLAARSETTAVTNGSANVVSSSNNAFVTSLSTSAFTPAPSKLANETHLSFGAAAAAAASKAEAPAFGDKSGASVNKLFGGQTNSFGGSATTTSATATPLLFGNSGMGVGTLKSSETSAAASTFAAAPPPFQFGANASASAAAPSPLKPAAEMSLAGSAAPPSFAAATQPSVFNFGANAAPAPAAASAAQPAGSGFMFNGPKAEDGGASKFRFGAVNASPFGGATAGAGGASAPFAFGAAAPAVNAAEANERPPTNMLFGGVASKAPAVETQPAMANSINSGFGGAVFGAAPAQPGNAAKKSGGFSFNATPPSFAAPTVNNFSTFANPNANQESKPPFVFGSPNPAPPQNHNFNMNIPAAFNFTAGTNQMMPFSATPSATNATPNACSQVRKIKKAVRRTTQQK